MKKISDFIKVPLAATKKVPNSARAEITEQVCTFMDGDNKRFKYWLGRTKEYTPSALYDIMKKAKEGKNPQALFNWNIKK